MGILNKKKIAVVWFVGLLLAACSDDDDEINCELFDPAFPALFLRIVDDSGTNRIENGTVDPENIEVEGDFLGAGFQFIPANEFADPDSSIRELDNTLNLSLPNESRFRYLLRIDNFEPVTITFTAELTEIPCDIIYFTPIRAESNGQELELQETFPLEFLVVLEL